jgi:hypothetical protein
VVRKIVSFNFSFGAHDQGRTGDLILTKDVLYQLSYVGQEKKENLSQREDRLAGFIEVN